MALKAIRIEAEAIYRESLNFVETRPLQRLSRGASVGAVLIEQARLSDDLDEIAELAWGARAYIRVHLDFYAGDADTEPAFEIRFGDACWMSDSPEKARETWERARDWAIRASQEDLVPALERRLSTGAPMFGEGVDYRGGSASPGSV